MRMALLAAAGLILAACAQTGTEAGTGTDTASAAAPAGRDCFRNDDVAGFNVVDDRTVSLSIGTRRYLLTTNFNTRDLDWGQQIGLRSSTGWICTGNGLGVEIIGGQPRRTYFVTSIARAPEPPPAQGS